jgi:hypothetical protein
MTYRFTGKDKKGNAVEPLPGLPLEASDRDFNEALREREAVEGEGFANAVRNGGLYEHVREEKDDKTPARNAEEG